MAIAIRAKRGLTRRDLLVRSAAMVAVGGLASQPSLAGFNRAMSR